MTTLIHKVKRVQDRHPAGRVSRSSGRTLGCGVSAQYVCHVLGPETNGFGR